MYDALIIGGGITGLCCAHRLQARGRRICLAEPNGFGGSMKTTLKEGFTLEHGPNVMLMNDAIRSLIDEVGLGTSVTGPAVTRYRQYVWYEGKPTNVPKSPFQFFACPLFSRGDRLGLMPRLFRKNLLRPAAPDESVAVFFGRLLSEHAITHLVDPALKGIYGGDAKALSARSLFSQLWEHAAGGGSIVGYMQKRKREGARKRELFVLQGGMQSLVKAILGALEGKVNLLPASVTTLGAGSDGFHATLSNGESAAAREVYITTSGASTAAYIELLAPEIAHSLRAVRYAAIAVVHAAVPRSEPVPGNSFGVLFPAGFPLLGIMYNSSLFPHIAPPDQHLLTICLGGAGQQQRVAEFADADLEQLVCDELRSRLGVANARVLNINRWSHAIPQYEVGHHALLARMGELEAKLPGLHFMGVDRPGISVPDRVKAVFQHLA